MYNKLKFIKNFCYINIIDQHWEHKILHNKYIYIYIFSNNTDNINIFLLQNIA